MNSVKEIKTEKLPTQVNGAIKAALGPIHSADVIKPYAS